MVFTKQIVGPASVIAGLAGGTVAVPGSGTGKTLADLYTSLASILTTVGPPVMGNPTEITLTDGDAHQLTDTSTPCWAVALWVPCNDDGVGTNTKVVWVGTSANQYLPLTPDDIGVPVSLYLYPTDNANKVYYKGTASNKLRWAAVV